MAYLLFILVNATLFIRPAEIMPEVAAWPIYQVLILACFVVALPSVLDHLQSRPLAEQPITLCVFGIWAAVVMSHLSHFFIWGARMDGMEFGKIVIYYLLLVSLVDSERRLRNFLFLLTLFIITLAALALLQYHGKINIPSLAALERHDITSAGERIELLQLRSTGIFNDPNDLAMILVPGVVLCLYFALDRAGSLLRAGWLFPLGMLFYAFALTNSRGGFLAMLAALTTLAYYRWGWKKAFAAAALVVPVLFAALKGRMTDLEIEGGTGQSRVQLWSEALGLFKQAPIFGIGRGNMVEEGYQVAHNSFVHAFTELGLFGGTFFLGAFFIGLVVFHRLTRHPETSEFPELHRAIPYLAAVLVGFAVSMLSLSRNYVVPTYMILGLAAIAQRLASDRLEIRLVQFDSRLASRLAVLSVGFILATYVFIRATVRWS
ncbi:MAG: O-antigen ligase family protein [Thermoguttaceae bacterium]|jgi:O-antigen ligase